MCWDNVPVGSTKIGGRARKEFEPLPKLPLRSPSWTLNRLLYQKIAQEANQLRNLGLNYSRIAEYLAVDHKTVAKAIRWLGKKGGLP